MGRDPPTVCVWVFRVFESQGKPSLVEDLALLSQQIQELLCLLFMPAIFCNRLLLVTYSCPNSVEVAYVCCHLFRLGDNCDVMVSGKSRLRQGDKPVAIIFAFKAIVQDKVEVNVICIQDDEELAHHINR